ncbi:MAG TPA: metalloregulator ArsR/SmtB family transcription factor [Acidimicrobiia bacterium]|nr:metalloregulator ArsR/SmtB family transcription factor [Acidimicrobiia bacterium]
MTPEPKDYQLRLDASERRTRFEVVARPESIFDVMLALWSAFGGDDMVQQHEVGKKYFDNFRQAVPAETIAQMESAGLDDGSLWATLLSYVAANAPLGDDEALLQWLEATEADIAGEVLCELAWAAEADDVEAAVSRRDPDALDTVLDSVKEHARACVRTAMKVPVGDLGPTVAKVLRSVRDTAYAPHLATWVPSIAASAESTRILLGTLDPNSLLERVTNGISYEIPLGTRQLVLVPTVTLRPWTLVADFGDSIVVAYAVADEHLDQDPDAAPGWLVRFHKALGDDKRLRILREVANGGSTLGELTEVLGLAKSTVFHHMGILRSAGLVRVVLGKHEEGINSYQLRHEAFADADVQLQKYLEVVITPEGNRS